MSEAKWECTPEANSGEAQFGKGKLMRVVVKIGGSLIREAPELIDRLIKEFGSGNSKVIEKDRNSCDEGYLIPFSLYREEECLLMPSGQRMKEFSLGDDAAHWMAILGMEQYAFYLRDKSSAVATDSITDISQGVSILFPYKLLKTEDPLPHTWDVTSDTIAAWVAKQTGAGLLRLRM